MLQKYKESVGYAVLKRYLYGVLYSVDKWGIFFRFYNIDKLNTKESTAKITNSMLKFTIERKEMKQSSKILDLIVETWSSNCNVDPRVLVCLIEQIRESPLRERFGEKNDDLSVG